MMFIKETRCLRVLKALKTCRLYSSHYKVKPYDVLFLRQQGVKYPKYHLTTPLRPDAKVKLSYGASIEASELIGRQILDRVADSKGNPVTLYEPTLASYIINSERMATPIYPHDASTIVSLLALNPERYGEVDPSQEEEPFEIFEAGTGMGSLTLHLAHAIHAGNPPMSPSLRQAMAETPLKRDKNPAAPPGLHLNELEKEFEAYRKSRRVIIHTLDRNPNHTRAAYKLVRGFRRAQYLADIDFHIGSIGEYINKRLEASGGRPFLSRAVLDLPGAHDNAEDVIKALHPNATLILFNPSISQIAEFHAWMMQTGQPIRLEKVLELPTSTNNDGVHDGGGGGRHWDVKTVIPKVFPNEDGSPNNVESKPVQVMRPKVGDRIAGGGFVAVLRRWPQAEPASLESPQSVNELNETSEGSIAETEPGPKAREDLQSHRHTCTIN